MKYPQLVHMPRDVEHWLEKQLEALGINEIASVKDMLWLLALVNTSQPIECFSCNSDCYDKYGNKRCFQAYCDRQSWDIDSLSRIGAVHYPMWALKEIRDIEKLVDELSLKLKEFENKGTVLFDVSANLENNYSQMDAPLICSDALLSGNLINMSEVQTFPSCDSIWTRGLLHDSKPVKDQNKMEDYFSSLFYENPSDNFGFEFTRFKSDERQDGKEQDRINYYNKQNLLASNCTERLYERNTDIDKLIAKFDANIEGIWKPYESENLGKYESLLTENILTNPYIQSGSSLVWSFDQNGNDFVNNEKMEKTVKENIEQYKPNFSAWNKLSSPVLTSNLEMNALMNSVNLTLANVQKWSSIDGQSDENNISLNHNRYESGFTKFVPKLNYFGANSNLRTIQQERNMGNGDEEDLLTSAKTHFRPIRMEEMQANQTVAYEDGTTFAISNEFEKVTFTRSNSGILYLDTDSEFETPRKYMEFKEINTKLFDSESDLSLMEEFVPKFRIRQSNEKCCQTEDVIEDEQIVPSLNETDCDSDSYECEGDEFFFPGDSELAENITNKMDEEGKMEFRRIKSDCNYNDIYVADNAELMQKINTSQCVCGNGTVWLPSNEYEMRQEWSDIWCQENADEDCKCIGVGLPTKEEYFRFREELTQEGEQLLSDLSSLQQLYSSSKWGDDESGTVSDFNEDENDSFSSLNFIDKFKSITENAGWKNFWFGTSEMSKSTTDENVIRMENKLLKATEKNLSNKLNEIRERPFINEKSQKEKKRRNSVSQKVCNLYADGQSHRTHYRFSFCDPTNTHPDASRMRGDTYELFKSLKRPLSF